MDPRAGAGSGRCRAGLQAGDLQILTLYSVLPAKTSAQLEQQLEELLRGKDVQRSVVSIIADLEQERE